MNFFNSSIQAQDSARTRTSAFYLGLNRDNFYGFAFYTYGYYDLNKKKSLFCYTIIREGTQIGAGVRFALNKKLSITPVLGIINGNALSGGTRQVIADGAGFAFLTNYTTKRFYFEEVFFYYKSVRKLGPNTSDFLWYWLTLGAQVGKKLTMGLHLEQLYRTRMSNGKPSNLYQFLAPFIQFNFYHYSYIRLTAGYNFPGSDRIGSEFARVSMVYSFIEK